MKKIFYFVLFYLPFQIYFNLFPEVDLASGRVLIIILFLFLLASLLIKREVFLKFTLIDFFVSFFLFFMLISIGFSADFNWSIRKILFLFSFFPVYFMGRYFIKNKKDLEKAFSWIVGASFLVAVLGIVQFFGQFILGRETIYNFWSNFIAPYFFGASFSGAVLANSSWLVNIFGNTLLRATATFPDPHMLSFFLSLALGINLSLVVVKKKPQSFWVVSFLFIFLANILTFSRGGYLGFLAATVFGLIIFFSRSKISGRLIVSSLFLVLILFLTIPSFFNQRFFSSFDLKEGSNRGRIETWEKSWSVLKKHSLTGVGIGSYPFYIKANADYREPFYAHSNYLDIWLDGGLGALLSWISLLIFSFVIFLKKISKDIVFLGPILSLIAFSIHSLFETSIYSISVLPIFLVIISLASLNDFSSKNENV